MARACETGEMGGVIALSTLLLKAEINAEDIETNDNFQKHHLKDLSWLTASFLVGQSTRGSCIEFLFSLRIFSPKRRPRFPSRMTLRR